MRSFLPLLILGVSALQAQDTPINIDVRVSGLIVSNFFYNNHEVNNSDVPTIAVGTGVSGLPDHALGATVRQSMLRVVATMAGWAGGDLTGEIETDFFGGQMPSGGGRTHPLLRIRRAFVRMDWPSISLLIGQEAPPIVEVNPSSLASLGFPGFAAAGNLWLWLPQIRATSHVTRGEGVRFDVEAAVMAPHSGEAQGTFLTQPDQAELSGRPNFEGRVVARWGGAEAPGEIGLGGHLGWLFGGGDSTLTSHAIAAAMRIPLGRVFEIRGEVFHGEALAGLGGGGIGQNVGAGGETVETTGGWAQLLLHRDRWELGAGWGIDDPKEAGLDPLTRREQNSVVAFHILFRPSPIVLGLEYRHLETTYDAAERNAHHINLAAGIEF